MNKTPSPYQILQRIWAFDLNGKLGLYLEDLGLTEKCRIFIPQTRQAPER